MFVSIETENRLRRRRSRPRSDSTVVWKPDPKLTLTRQLQGLVSGLIRLSTPDGVMSVIVFRRGNPMPVFTAEEKSDLDEERSIG